MTMAASTILVAAAVFTAFLSGIFGMAGGLLLMGVLALLLPVSAAFVTHGFLQLVANGWRALLHRRHIAWRIIGFYVIASIVAGLAVWLVAFQPSKRLLYLLLGLVPMLVWLPRRWLALDASRPGQAFVSGLLVTGLNLTAGVAGPLLDVFFVNTKLDRHQIVATKAATQVFSHLAKIIVYGLPLVHAGAVGVPSAPVLAAAVVGSMIGTTAGGRVLARLTNDGFKRWTAWIVTAIGVVYLVRAAVLP
jgi:uncharacterized membrane protein YfcA